MPVGARFCDECGAAVGDTATPGSAPAPHGSATHQDRVAADPRSYTPRHLADRILTSRSALQGERKQVTVLFADVVESTALAEGLDPEAMHDIMDHCFQLLLAEVHRFEGTVNQFTGDGIMALFGAPIAHEDAPERAIRAALGMQAAVQEYASELRSRYNIDFRMRIGINSGPVVVGKIGDDLRMDYTAVGDSTNLAARLQTAARPGTILISDHTAKLTGARFATRPVGPLVLKGKSEAVTAYEVLRALPRLPLVAGSEQRLTPLVGRRAELSALETVFDHVLQGHGQVAFIVGEAGIGKSRLLYEFQTRLRDRDVIWLEGRCVSFGHSIPLLPIVDVVKGRFNIGESDSEETVVEKVQQGIAALGDAAPEIGPYLAALLTDAHDAALQAMDASARRFATFDAMKKLLLASAGERPTVILIEDLHWIDQASEEFLTYIVEPLASARVMLICTHRPGYRPTLGERSYVTRLALQPLSPLQTTELAEGMLGAAALPAEIRTMIARKAEGNPFFIEEVTKSLVEIGALDRSDDSYILGRPLTDILIPDRIQDVIMARIDRLGDDSKHAMQVASVIGREFAVRLLQRAAMLGERVAPLVGELRSLELIYEKSGVPELAYMFKHALTHDVAYESLLLNRRKQLHGIIARAIEELYADRLSEYWETLAHHFYRAEDWPRAFEYLLKAGDKARAAYANNEAAYFYERALEAAVHVDVPPAQRAALLEGKARAKHCLSEFTAAIDAYRSALELVSDPQDRARLLAALAEALVWAHEFDAALDAANDAFAIAQPAGHQTLAIQTTFTRGFVFLVRGQLQQAEEIFEHCNRSSRRTSDFTLHALGTIYSALHANWRGEYGRSIDDYVRVMPQIRAANELLMLCESYSHFGIALGGAGQYARALAELNDGIAVAESIGDKVWRARMWNTRGWLLGELGAYEEAEEANRRCIEFMRDLGSLRFASEFVANAEVNLADTALWRGDPAAAEPHLATVGAILADPRNEWMAWRYGMHYNAAAADLALARGDLSAAKTHVEACRATAHRTRSRRYLVKSQRLLAACHFAAGDFGASEAILAQTVRDATSLGNPTQLWHTALAHGRVLQQLGRRDEAQLAWRTGVESAASAMATLPLDVRVTFASSKLVTALQALTDR